MMLVISLGRYFLLLDVFGICEKSHYISLLKMFQLDERIRLSRRAHTLDAWGLYLIPRTQTEKNKVHGNGKACSNYT